MESHSNHIQHRTKHHHNSGILVASVAIVTWLHLSICFPALGDHVTSSYRRLCWLHNYSNPDMKPVDHTPLPFLLGASDATCPVCRGEIFLLIMVQSALPNRARRELIRQTWASVGNIDGDRIATAFIVGRSANPRDIASIRQESDINGDIIQADFMDTYRNLTYKHLYALRWITERCKSVQYVMKVDDDGIVNVFHLREALREQLGSAKGNFFYCEVTQTKPLHEPGIKWSISWAEWPGNMYPRYCRGFGYVMTGSLIVHLHQCAKWRRYFWIDDVFVSGDLASALGVPRIQWRSGWGSADIDVTLAGPRAAQVVLANGADNSVYPTLHKRIWLAMIKYSWGV